MIFKMSQWQAEDEMMLKSSYINSKYVGKMIFVEVLNVDEVG